MTKALACAVVVCLCGGGVAHAEETATLVINGGGEARFNRALPAGVQVKIQLPISDSDPTKGLLTIYPKLGECSDPGEGAAQRQQYGMSITGNADGHVLEATISPLQIATVYCIQVSYEHGLSTDRLNKLADMIAATKIDWAGTCSVVDPDPTHRGRFRRADRSPSDQIETVRAALEAQLTSSLEKLREGASKVATKMTTELLTEGAPVRVHEAAVVLTKLLDVPAQCFRINAKLRDEDRASQDEKDAAGAQHKAAESVKKLPTETQSWPAVVIMNGTTPVAMRLIDAINQPTALNSIVAHVDLADHQLALDLAELADPVVADAVAKRAKLRAKLAAPPSAKLPVVIWVPSLSKSLRAADLFRSADFDRGLVVDAAKNREVLVRQLELLQQQDKPTSDAWVAALGRLADQASAALDAMQHYKDAEKARTDAEGAPGPALKLLVQSETMKAQLRKTEIVRDTPAVALRQTDDNASWIAPTIGVMVAAPYLASERRFADPWLVPYLGASVYFTRVDRVIDINHLVGPPRRLFWQRNSFSVGFLLSRPSVRNKEVTGPWKADVVPFLGFGHRFTQYIRADLGAIIFQYHDRIPVVTELHWSVAGWLGLSLDADVWAVFSGKIGK